MAKIGNAAYFGTTGKLEIGADEYTAAVTSCQLSPNIPSSAVTDIGGGVTSMVGSPAWVADIAYNQDWTTVNSLSQYLIANHGQVKVFKYTPAAGGKVVTFSAKCVAGVVGGGAGALHAATVNLPIDGQPVFA